jgi:hypothetical protein
MSALRSVAERRRRFPLLAVLWYNLGTGFDVATHLIMAAALAPHCCAAAVTTLYGNCSGTRLTGLHFREGGGLAGGAVGPSWGFGPGNGWVSWGR